MSDRPADPHGISDPTPHGTSDPTRHRVSGTTPQPTPQKLP